MNGVPAMAAVAGPVSVDGGTERPAVTVRRDGPVGVVVLASQPRERVQLTPERLEALLKAIRRLAGRSDVALLVLLGGAREFCIGADLARLRSAPAADAERYLRLGQSVMTALAEADIPTVAAVGGLAFGGGFELALACDLRWAHRRAVFALPEAQAGVMPAWGAAAALARDLPGASAWELLVGGRIGAGRAADLGLVGRVFDGPGFEDQAIAAARGIAALGRDTLAGLKAVWRAARSGDEAAARRRDREVCLERLAAAAGRESAAMMSRPGN